MIEKLHLNGCPKFTLILKSHTQKKRLIEARNALLYIYPFEIEEKKLFIVRTNTKGHYDVYISKEDINHNKNKQMLILIFLFCLIALVLFVVVMRHTTIKKIEEVNQQRTLEKQKQEEVRIRKENEEKLENLKNQYNEKQEARYEKIYPYIERIYSVMTDKTIIENISIDKDLFTVEVTTTDSIIILSNFEKSKAFSSIKMNRTNIKDGKESVTYSGEFSKYILPENTDLTLEEKLDFYTERIIVINEREKKQKHVQLSEYIQNIRTILHKNSCQEQYIQLRGKDNNIEIEFFILSTSKNILRFINEIQDSDENLIDIKSVKIRNSEDRERIQTTVLFDTNIELDQNNELFAEYVDVKIELSEIDKIFYKAITPKPVVSKYSLTQTSQQNQIVKTKDKAKLKKLTYIGLTKSNGRTLVLVKDEEMESIYKLIQTDVEIDGDCCIKNDGGFIAKLRGEYYEVKK